MDANQLMRDFGPASDESCGIQFDWSYLLECGDPNLWTINVWTNISKRNLFMNELAAAGGSIPVDYVQHFEPTYRKLLLSYLDKDSALESDRDIYGRAQQLKRFIRAFKDG